MSDEIKKNEACLVKKISDFLFANVPGLKLEDIKIYAKILYDHKLTTERRILVHITANPNWMIENGFNEYDSYDIIECLRTNALATTTGTLSF